MNTREVFSGNTAEGTSRLMSSGLALGAASRFGNTALMSRVQPPAILVELVERFQVCWGTVPEFAVLANRKRRVGFDLELYGNHGSCNERTAETCIHCHNVFGSLHVIADWALPRPIMHDAGFYFPCLTDSHGKQKPLEVRFSLRVVHREASDKIAEETVAQWSRELEWRLRELGASQRIAR